VPNKKLVAKEDTAAWVNKAFHGDTNAGPGGCSDGGRAKSGSGMGEPADEAGWLVAPLAPCLKG